MRLRGWILLLLLVLLTMSACSGISSAPFAATIATPTPASGAQITLTTNPNPPKSGDLEVIVQVKDASGQPFDGATVLVIADHTEMKGMNMQGKATAQGNGRYAIAANFAMSGKWRLTVQVNKGEAPALVQEFSVELK